MADLSCARPVLLVEDNPVDIDLTKRAFARRKLPNPIHVVRDGEEALACIPRWEAGEPMPLLILLDLKLPRVSGHAVLGAIKLDPDLSRIPIVVLSSSHAPQDQERSYDLEADHYITKPVGLDLLAGELKIIEALAGRGRN